MSQSVFLPNYTIGTDAYEKANGIVKELMEILNS